MIKKIIKDFIKYLIILLFIAINLGLCFGATFCFPGLNDKQTIIAFIITIIFFTLEFSIIQNTKYKL